MCSRYIISLVKSEKIEQAELEFNSMKKQYKELTDKKSQHENAMLSVYDTFIIYFFDEQKHPSQAIQWFEDAVKNGFYQNNRLQVMDTDKTIKLDFHWDKNYKVKEGGLSLTVAKVAFLYFIKQMTEKEIHFPAKVITGGHLTNQAKLKDEFPEYLHKEYSIDIEWNENKKILEFIIPYHALRKIRLVQDILVYMSFCEEQPNENSAIHELERQYRADLRRDNERKPNKFFSEEPIIPGEFDEESYKLAKQSIVYFDKKNYGESEKLRRELIAREAKHPWPYIHLGWLLHRIEKFDEAIDEYQKAIARINQIERPNDKLLSDTYRKMGWAYDRKHRSSKSISDLNKAYECYQKSRELDPENIELNHYRLEADRL